MEFTRLNVTGLNLIWFNKTELNVN